jgi:hypothetical protein
MNDWCGNTLGALLGWVKDDAEFISERIAANADDRRHANVETEATRD